MPAIGWPRCPRREPRPHRRNLLSRSDPHRPLTRTSKGNLAGLADEWQAAVAPVSSTTARVRHHTYRQIVGLGPAVVPLLLREARARPNHWFAALRASLATTPSPADRGRLDLMAEAWIRLGQRTRLPVMDHLETLFPSLSGSDYVVTSPAEVVDWSVRADDWSRDAVGGPTNVSFSPR